MSMDYLTPRWYVLQAMSGQENKAQLLLQTRMNQDRAEGIEDGILEVVIPTERIEERKNGKKSVRNRKLYPGYVLVKAVLYKEDGTLDPLPWGIINDTNGIIGFVGGDKPAALSQSEVDDMVRLQQEEEVEKPKVVYEAGETVIIKEGAFENYEGQIESIDNVRQKLTVSVSIFGRQTPVEVEIWQVERPS